MCYSVKQTDLAFFSQKYLSIGNVNVGSAERIKPWETLIFISNFTAK
jgi:hypothetical protein